jgi:hypothetical protein
MLQLRERRVALGMAAPDDTSGGACPSDVAGVIRAGTASL